jgi:hypothetical protein
MLGNKLSCKIKIPVGVKQWGKKKACRCLTGLLFGNEIYNKYAGAFLKIFFAKIIFYDPILFQSQIM